MKTLSKNHAASPLALRAPDGPAWLVQMVQTVARRQIAHASATIKAVSGESIIPTIISPPYIIPPNHQFLWVSLNLKALLPHHISPTSTFGYPPPPPSADPARESRLATSVVVCVLVFSVSYIIVCNLICSVTSL